MEQKKNKFLLLAGVITLAASMLAGCTEYAEDPAEFTTENIVINYTDSVIDASISSGSRTRSVSESTEIGSSILTSKTGNKMYLCCTETPWPLEKTALTRGAKVTTAGISNMGVCASVYAASSSYTSAGCGSYFYKESVVSGTPMTYYWPISNYKISFFGYYPYNNAAFLVQSAANVSGAPTYSYTVPSAIASQQDIMTGQVTDRPGGSASSVNMTLSHRCAAIRFNITNDRSEAITVNSISIEGVKYTGTLNENTWTLGDAVNSSSSNPFTLTCNTSVAAEATADITGTSNIFMMLPQTLPSGAKLKVVVDDEEFETEISGSWAQGSSYIYTISMSEDDPMPIGTVLTYGYTGGVQSVELPAGQYRLQCWGAQGGSNAAASTYSITSKTGGKGGYSEGVITLSQPTTLKVYVGGQGSSSSGGYNGGGSTTGSSSKETSDETGRSYMGGGGGATDIRLSDGSLYSRFIVAGGGSGGAMCYKKIPQNTDYYVSYMSGESSQPILDGNNVYCYYDIPISSDVSKIRFKTTNITTGGWTQYYRYSVTNRNGTDNNNLYGYTSDAWNVVNSSYYSNIRVRPYNTGGNIDRAPDRFSIVVEKYDHSVTSYQTENASQNGYSGGGTTGAGYSDTYKGKQNAAGTNGSFGRGGNQTATNKRYCSGAGGGGWYGGGCTSSDSDKNYCKYSGGGSGFVNTAANASYRPAGYTGLELDSGTTYAGTSSFPNTAGTGNETGHSGNGYAKITRTN